MWLSVFPIRSATQGRPPGVYTAAFVDYQEGSVLSYRELLVARLVRDGRVPRIRLTDMWVDSESSRRGGRSLWAMPKELADLRWSEQRLGPTAQASGDAGVGGAPIAAARFTAVRAPALRTPLRLSTTQEREDGTMVVASATGSARSTPCLGSWDFTADGPLGWLRGRRPVLSLRLADLRIRIR
jgi:acetoacetate decarboxylase